MCQSTKGGCTFSECNIIALEVGTRMPLNQSRSLGLGLQFHILSPSPPLFFRSLLLSHLLLLLCLLLFSIPAISTCSPLFSLVFCCPVSCPSLVSFSMSLSRNVAPFLTEIIHIKARGAHASKNRGKRGETRHGGLS